MNSTLRSTAATLVLLVVVALCALWCPPSASAQTAYTLTTLTSGNNWTNSTYWNPSTSANGPGNTGGALSDIAILPLGTATWSMNLNSSPTIQGLNVSNTSTITFNAGTPATSSFTFHGAAVGITNTSANTLTINPGVYLDTANAILTTSNNGTVYIVNPGGTFFSNLNPAGGLNVGGSILQIGNVTNNLPPLSNLKAGVGQLTLNLANTTIGSTFFTNQTLGLGGTGVRDITGVVSFTNAAGTPMVLTNYSTGILELDLSTAVLSTNFFYSLGGISSVSGKNGNIKINVHDGS